MTLPVINSVWIGSKLGPIHAACLASFVRNGHRTVLHTFEPIVDVPKGVELFDATLLMNKDEILRYQHNSSSSLASNIYRLRIQRENMGIYVDCDVYCLKPFPDEEYLFGWEAISTINGAVLRLPADSDLLNTIISDAENPEYIPPGTKGRRKQKLRIRSKFLGLDTRPQLGWGTLGPSLLTYHALQMGMEGWAKDIDVFYPLHHQQKNLLYKPDLTIEDLTTRRSFGLHLWSSGPQMHDILPGSVVDQIISAEKVVIS